jgi:hypothetical protein
MFSVIIFKILCDVRQQQEGFVEPYM